VKRLLREPLLHFLLLGAGLFVAYGLRPHPGRDEAAGRIVVTQGQIENLADGFARAWQRPPTSEELAGLIRDHVREEVYCREAIALGLDKDDSVIRRRLRQKLQFVSDDIAAQAEPTDAELNAYLQARPDAFRSEPRFTFRQVYLDPERHGTRLAHDAAELLEPLRGAGGRADLSTLGDPFLLESSFTSAPASELVRQFGAAFVSDLSKLPLGEWLGPLRSGYGAHLVFVSERTQARLPELAAVRGAVRREWENARRQDANERFYQALLKRYQVTIEQPTTVQGQRPLAARQ
jgi:hypothetical protein